MLLLDAILFMAVPFAAGLVGGRRLLASSSITLSAWAAFGSLLLAVLIGYFTLTGLTWLHPLVHFVGNVLIGILVAAFVSWRSAYRHVVSSVR